MIAQGGKKAISDNSTGRRLRMACPFREMDLCSPGEARQERNDGDVSPWRGGEAPPPEVGRAPRSTAIGSQRICLHCEGACVGVADGVHRVV